MEQRIVQPSKTRSPLLVARARVRRILDFEAGRASLLVPSAVRPSLSPTSSLSSLASRSKPISFINRRFWRTSRREKRDESSRWRWYRYRYICIESTRKVIRKRVLDIVPLQRYVSPNNRNTYAANSFGTSNPIVLDKTRPGYGFFEMVTAVFGGERCEPLYRESKVSIFSLFFHVFASRYRATLPVLCRIVTIFPIFITICTRATCNAIRRPRIFISIAIFR